MGDKVHQEKQIRLKKGRGGLEKHLGLETTQRNAGLDLDAVTSEHTWLVYWWQPQWTETSNLSFSLNVDTPDGISPRGFGFA